MCQLHILLLSVLIALVTCADLAKVKSNRQQSSTQFPQFTAASCRNLPTLVCNVQPTEGSSTTGMVYFSPVWQKRDPDSNKYTCYTRIRAVISGLINPLHGFHVHTYGDLSFTDGTSTGGHFTNPAGDESILHGYPDDEVRHWGDFGNLQNNGTGMAEYNRIDKVIRLGAVVGRAITIHEGEDQGVSEQPSGDSGSRIGFCVIGYSNPEVVSSAAAS